MRRAVLFLPALAAALGLAVWLGLAGANLIEARARAAASEALAAASADWAAVEVDGLVVTLGGIAPDRAARERVRALLAGLLPLARLDDATTLAPPAPPPPSPPPALDLFVDRDEVAVRGLFPDEEARAAFLARLARHLPSRRLSDLAATGARGVEGWGRALEVAALAVAGLDAGRVTLRADAGATREAKPRLIVSGSPANDAETAALAARLRAAAGDALTLTLDLVTPRVPPPAPTRAGKEPAPPSARGASAPVQTSAEAPAATRLALTWDGTRLALTGNAGSPVASRTLALTARARFGPLVHADLDTEAPVPPGWRKAARAAMNALAKLPAGEAEVTPGTIRLSGRTRVPALAGRVHRALASAAPDGWIAATAVTVDLPAAVASVPFNPARCASLLNRVLAATPLRFTKAEARLAPEAAPVLDRLAAILRRCEGRLEIGGHTDNRGRAAFNERLSRARANAVLDALLARGVPLRRLVAKGYGESRPVAPNDTEEGRARNRRIEFRALSCGEGGAAATGGGAPC